MPSWDRSKGMYRARGTDPESGKRISLGLYDSRQDAARVERMHRERCGPVTGLTVGALGQRFMDRRELEGYHRSERSHWQHVARAPISAVLVKRLERRHVHDWVTRLRETEAVNAITRKVDGQRVTERRPAGRTIARQTAKHAFNLLRGSLDMAANEGAIKSNPAQGVRLGRWDEREPRWTFLTVDEIRAVMATAPHVFTVAIFTGLRQAELTQLRWERVHLEGSHPYLAVGGKVKTAKSYREVPLLPPAVRALKARRDRHFGFVFSPDRGVSAYSKGHEFHWADHVDNERGLARLGWRWRCRVRRRVRFHDLRHTCASHLVMGTWGRAWRLEEVRDFLGHKSVRTTEMYAHLDPKGIKGAVLQMSEAWTDE